MSQIYRPQIPEITSYPLIDFACKVADEHSNNDLGSPRSSDITLRHGDSDIRGALTRMRLVKRKIVDT